VFGKGLEAFVERLGAIHEILQTAGDDPEWKAWPVHLPDVLWIQREAANSMMAAYQLVRHGYWEESLFVVRHALEIVALSVHLWQKPEIQDLFRKNKWDPKKSIGPAGKILPNISRVWGHLSDHLHPGASLLFRGYLNREREDGRATYTLGGGMYPENEFYFRHAIRDILACGSWLHAAAELAFARYVPNRRFWRIEDDVAQWQPVEDELRFFEQLDQFGQSKESVIPPSEYKALEGFAEEHHKKYDAAQEALDHIRRSSKQSAT
jgi:hypothetical protein